MRKTEETSPALRGREVGWQGSAEGEGDRVGTLRSIVAQHVIANNQVAKQANLERALIAELVWLSRWVAVRLIRGVIPIK